MRLAFLRIASALEMAIARILPRRRRSLELQGTSMGTTWRVKGYASKNIAEIAIHGEIVTVLDNVVRQMSTWTVDSDLARYNRASAGSWVSLPADCLSVLVCAMQVARESGGAYDPSVLPLVELWGFGPSGPRHDVPTLEAISMAAARCGWQRIEVDREAHRVHQPGGISLDLCAIAKGFAVDTVARCLDESGIDNYLVEIGGEMRARGMRADGQPWRVGIESPDGAHPDFAVSLHECAIATSGDQYHSFQHGARRYSHCIDPRSAKPIAHGLTSVSVVHCEAMWADAYATALTVLGLDHGMRLAKRLHLPARFVQRTPHGFEYAESEAFSRLLHK